MKPILRFEQLGSTQEHITEPCQKQVAIDYDRAVRVRDATAQRLAELQPIMLNLAKARYNLYPNMALEGDVNGSLDQRKADHTTNLDDLLYDMPSYDSQLLRGLLGVRGSNEFHNEREVYTPQKTDTNEQLRQKASYRQAILHAAAELGFVEPDPQQSADELERKMGVRFNTEDLIDEPVRAIIVPGAAGIANPARLNAARLAIEHGTIQTDAIIVTACERPTNQGECDRVAALNIPTGATEYEACLRGAEVIYDISEWSEELITPDYPSDEPIKTATAVTQIGEKSVKVTVLSAPISRGRMNGDKLANRANTWETFEAAKHLVEPDTTLAVMSHDTWREYQDRIAQEVFGLKNGNTVITTGPTKTDRVVRGHRRNTKDITAAEGVVDELAKTYMVTMEVNIKAINAVEKAKTQLTLLAPVPRLDEVREQKSTVGYRELPIDQAHELHNEPLQRLADYGIAGQSYYSRANAATIQAVDGVERDVYVRQSVAERLQQLNAYLSQPAVSELFHGHEIELYVEEGVRTFDMQQRLYEELMPGFIKAQNPDLTDDQVDARRDQLIARPSDKASPSPHATGGAVDIRLRYKPGDSWTPDYIDGSLIDMGHKDGEVSKRVNPDFYETAAELSDQDMAALRNRRILYNAMVDAGFAVNPTEYWHFGMGDQLSSLVSGRPAYYGRA